MPLLEGLDGVEKMSKSKNNYIGISEEPNTMFAKVLSISDVLMWKWYTLLSFKSEAQIAALKAEVEGGRNPKDAKVALAKEITARFHSAAAADGQSRTSTTAAGACPIRSTRSPCLWRKVSLLSDWCTAQVRRFGRGSGEGNRLIDGGGVRIDSNVVSDKGLKLGVGTYVLQVGKRKLPADGLTPG